MSQESGLAATAAALRRIFDRSFVELPATTPAAPEQFVAIRVAGDAYALRVSEIAGIHADRKIVPIPSSSPYLLGLACVRGTVLPVFDLRRVLGRTGAGIPRWLVQVRAHAPVGLAFDAFESHLRAVARAGDPGDAGSAGGAHVCGAIESGRVARPIVDVASVLETSLRESPA